MVGLNEEIRCIDLFGGIGGFRLGLEKASSKRDTESRSDSTDINGKPRTLRRSKSTFNCVWYCDIDKYATQVYNKNFKEHYEPTDITKIEPSDIPDHDLLCGGFPCQSFSIAGKRKGFQDTRGTMFFQICKIASEKRPRMLLLENVKGLLSHDEGNTFETILYSLSELGYVCEWQVLNSKDYGVPQNRERVFIVGHLREEPFKEIFPIGENNGTASKKLNVLQNSYYDTDRIYGIDGVARTMRSNAGGKGAKTGLYVVPVLTPDRLKKRQNGRRFKENGDNSFTLTGQDVHGVMVYPVQIGHSKNAWASQYGTNIGSQDEAYTIRSENVNGVMIGSNTPTVRTSGKGSVDRHAWDTLIQNNKIRRLTPVECERLQGFPDGWTEGISDTQRYKCLGNAVTVNVIEAIGKTMLNHLVEG